MSARWLRRRIVNPILDLLRQGITPEKVALSIALGLTLAAPPARITVGEIVSLIRADVWNAIATLWTATIHALVAWSVLGLLASLVIYALLAPLLRRLSQSLPAGSL